MRICPFLVAGQSMAAPQQRPGSRDAQNLLAPGRRVLVESDDGKFVRLDTGVELAKVGAPSATGLGLVRPRDETLESDGAPDSTGKTVAGPECLGESCRFFHAGGCRFDTLFASAAASSSVAVWLGGGSGLGGAAGGIASETGAGAGSDGISSPDGPAPVTTPPEVASIPFMLEEVWSLQREALREVIGGFRKLESLEAETLASVASGLQSQTAVVNGELRAQTAALNGELRSHAAVLNEVRALPPHPELVDLLRTRFAALSGDVQRLEAALRGALGDSGATVRSLLENSQAAVQSTVAGTEAGVRTALADTEARLRTLVEETGATARAAAEAAPVSVRNALADVQAQLGTLVSKATGETRAQLERGLTKLLEEIQEVRQVRTQLQTALDDLARETREASAVAHRIETSQAQTHQILDEQRQQAARSDARERREKARQLNNAGVMSYHQAAFETAVERFKQATELDPTLAEAYNNLGLAYTEMGRDDEASAAFQKALEIDPAAGQVYNNLGYLYYRRGDLSHAVDMYQRAIQRGQDTSAAYANLANAYYKMKRFDDAVAAWRRAIEIDPSNQRAASALERLGLEVRPA